MTTDLQAQRSIAEGFFGSTEQRSRTRQIEARPVEFLQIVQWEEGGGRLGGVVEVVVLQQLHTESSPDTTPRTSDISGSHNKAETDITEFGPC